MLSPAEKTSLLSAIAHLKSMPERCVIHNEDLYAICAYRDGQGGRCVVGFLISDEAYDPEIEGSSLSFSPDKIKPVLEKSLPFNPSEEFMRILLSLQEIHDGMYNWRAHGFSPASHHAQLLSQIEKKLNPAIDISAPI